jgi:hypothetical protein
MAYPLARCGYHWGGGGPGNRVWTSEQAKRKPTIRPLALTDFSRSRIDEHYETSHPAKGSEYQPKIEAKRRSAETSTDFFDVNNLISAAFRTPP